MSQKRGALKVRDYDWGTRLPTLDAGGVTLRALSSRDVPAMFEIFGDAEVARYWSRTAMPSRDEARELLEEIDSGFEQRQLFQWGIARQDDRVMGTCTVFQLDHNHCRCEIGFASTGGRASRDARSAQCSRFALIRCSCTESKPMRTLATNAPYACSTV